MLRELAEKLRGQVIARLDVPGLRLLENVDLLFELRVLGFRRQTLLPGTVGFLGSSSMRLWHSLKDDFAPLPVVNRGLGGSQVEHLVRYASDLLWPGYSAAVLYSGDNDIASGKSPEQIRDDWAAFFDIFARRCPEVPAILLSVKVSPSRETLADGIYRLNELMERLADERQITYLDISKPMMNRNNRPRASLYLWDGLHLSRQGYALWAALIWPVLEDLLARKRPGNSAERVALE